MLSNLFFPLELAETAIFPQVLNNQSDKSFIAKQDGQKSITFLPNVSTGYSLFFYLLVLKENKKKIGNY